MSVNVTRIIGYGIYVPYKEFKSKFTSDEYFENFCSYYGRVKVDKTCLALD